MRNVLNLSELELQIQDINIRLQQKQQAVVDVKSHYAKVMNGEQLKVEELASKSHMLAEALGDKVKMGLIRKFA
jgi:hypothetical protein